MTDIVRDPYGNPLNRDNLITALRAEVEWHKDNSARVQEVTTTYTRTIMQYRAEVEQLKREARFMAVSVLPEKDAEIEKLRAVLVQIARMNVCADDVLNRITLLAAIETARIAAEPKP